MCVDRWGGDDDDNGSRKYVHIAWVQCNKGYTSAHACLRAPAHIWSYSVLIDCPLPSRLSLFLCSDVRLPCIVRLLWHKMIFIDMMCCGETFYHYFELCAHKYNELHYSDTQYNAACAMLLLSLLLSSSSLRSSIKI